ncbi:MAG TPA: peptidylprolyl isomerase [Chloroflexota bacterium]|nr:peptidylprolyl isomerase [Chloroflexota bacterium]
MHALYYLALAGGLVAAACTTPTGSSRPTPAPTVPPRIAAPTSGPAATSPKQWSSPPPMLLDLSHQYFATLTTTLGEITLELFAQEVPLTVNNFVFLAREGFYDNVPFHRIIKGFMIQTGDPTGTGTGGPGYRFPDEPVTRDYEPGIVAMANAGPNTNGSQFFIMHGDRRGQLPKNYTIFGRVVSGMDVVDRIANVPVRLSPLGEPSVPTQDVRIVRVTITEQP